jgi:hypothetical protein
LARVLLLGEEEKVKALYILTFPSLVKEGWHRKAGTGWFEDFFITSKSINYLILT